MEVDGYKTLIMSLENAHMNTKVICSRFRCKNSERCTHDISLEFLDTLNDEIRGLLGKVRRLSFNSKLVPSLLGIDPKYVNEVNTFSNYLNRYTRVCHCDCDCKLAGECDNLFLYNDECRCAFTQECDRFGTCERCSDEYFREHEELGVFITGYEIDWDCDCHCDCKFKYKALHERHSYLQPCCRKGSFLHVPYSVLIAYTTNRLVEACKSLSSALDPIIESSNSEALGLYDESRINWVLFSKRKRCYCGGEECDRLDEIDMGYNPGIRDLKTMADSIKNILRNRERDMEEFIEAIYKSVNKISMDSNKGLL